MYPLVTFIVILSVADVQNSGIGTKKEKIKFKLVQVNNTVSFPREASYDVSESHQMQDKKKDIKNQQRTLRQVIVICLYPFTETCRSTRALQ